MPRRKFVGCGTIGRIRLHACPEPQTSPPEASPAEDKSGRRLPRGRDRRRKKRQNAGRHSAKLSFCRTHWSMCALVEPPPAEVQFLTCTAKLLQGWAGECCGTQQRKAGGRVS